ncbi:MAG: methionine aminotransferase [Bacteroidota bacterium]
MQSKLPSVGTTIFSTMSKMALDYGAINLAQGFPNFPVDEKLIEIFKENLSKNLHQYAPMAGNPLLIDEIIKLTKTQYQRDLLSTEVLVTAGATQAIFTAIQALVFKDDEVVIIDPAYDCYVPAVDLVGGKCVHVSLEKDFTLDWNKLEKAINSKTKLLIINNPHNPSGKILTLNDIENLKQIFEKNPHIYLLSDEVYEYITFEQKHISINSIPEIRERAIIVSSFGKTFHITGWKLGYLIAPEIIMNEIKKVHQFLVFSVNNFAQVSLANYLQVIDVSQLGKFYQEKRDYFRKLIKTSRFEILPSEGSFFQSLSYKEITSQKDTDFVVDLVKNHGVAAIPMSVFYKTNEDNQILRFCFAKDNLTLEQAADKLCKI